MFGCRKHARFEPLSLQSFYVRDAQTRDQIVGRIDPGVSDALRQLKRFNLEQIYLNPRIKKHTRRIAKLFEILFETYLDDIHHSRQSSAIYSRFMMDMTDAYIQSHRPAEVVRDFIAGMTDQYFLDQCPENLRPEIEPL